MQVAHPPPLCSKAGNLFGHGNPLEAARIAITRVCLAERRATPFRGSDGVLLRFEA